jgi:hypothetical protein
MSEHTKEPWRQEYSLIIGGGEDETNSFIVAKVDDWQNEIGDANARRIVACVNACAGISAEALDGISNGTDKRPPWLTKAWEEIEKTRKQRDGLLSLLKEHLADNPKSERGYCQCDLCTRTREAIKAILEDDYQHS